MQVKRLQERTPHPLCPEPWWLWQGGDRVDYDRRRGDEPGGV